MRLFVITLALAAAVGAAFAEEITLPEAIDFALARSPAAVAADSTYLSARADLYQGWGGIMPSAQLSYSASRYFDRDVLRFSGYEIPGYVPPAHYYYAQARLDQPLFAGGRLLWGVLSGRASARAGEADRTAQRHQLVVDVARAYFGVLKAQGLREVADLSLEASRHNEELAHAQYESEALSRAEYLAAVVQRGGDEIAAIAAESAAVTARLAFFNTVGMEPEPGLVFAQVESETPPPDLPSLERLLEEAMAGRPDVIKTREDKRMADLAVRSARAGWFPTVGASATYQWNDYNSPTSATWDDYDDWTLGLSASWYLFDSFQTKANVDRARAAAALTRSSYERLRDVVALDVTYAYYEYRRQAETVVVATETAAAAQEEFAIMQELYALGGASTLELTDAQARFVDAGNSLVEAKYDLLIADFDLHRALGDLPYR